MNFLVTTLRTHRRAFPQVLHVESKMSRYRRSAMRLHLHCESCHSRRCRAPIEISVSCMIINCRLMCGASFHLCKEEEHMLLCPNMKVPCLNSQYGCPFTMCRSRLAKHLEVCPASLVLCSMEWNRWPLEDPNADLYVNLSGEFCGKEPLDVAMALRDQKELCTRLKMRSYFPELTDEPEEESFETEEEGAVGGEILFNGMQTEKMDSNLSNRGDTPVLEAAEKDAQNTNIDREKYDLYEKMFSMERGGCTQAAVTHSEKAKTKDKKEKTPSKSFDMPDASEKSEATGESERTVERKTEPDVDISKTGYAPWQEGVLERLGQEVNPREFNMYIVHHGRMLISFGQLEACTPREKDFVYGNLEPIPVQTLHSFKVPTSYMQKRIHLKDPSKRVKTEHKCVDTSDLTMPEEGHQCMDETYATLLCSAELEIRGHKICETVATDGLYVDIATQTYSFASTPFQHNATLSDIITNKAVKLHVQIDTESITSRHHKFNSVFNFQCGHFFRRDEFASHFKNVHSDIQSGLNGWFEQRCPLAYLGCTFSQRRFQPSTQKATVSYNQELSIFTLKPDVPGSFLKDPQTVISQKKRVQHVDSLSALPFEVLRHIASCLDSFTLSQLALVSRLFREVCETLLQERGMVTLKWRKTYSHGRACWQSSIAWEFSSLFSKVDSWCFHDTPSISEHLKVCPYYKTESKVKPVPLASMSDNKGKAQEGKSLISLFMAHK